MNMRIADLLQAFEQWAPSSLQESYDNAGLIVGDAQDTVTGVMVSLDATEAVIDEAIANNCNLVVSHHPIVFSGLKRITGTHYVERAVIKAIVNRVALFAIHTNLDNVAHGVSQVMAQKLQLQRTRILQPKKALLKKLYTFVPHLHHQAVLQALFAAGAGHIGSYGECSFSHNGQGTFRAGPGTRPFVGQQGQTHTEQEQKIEVIVAAWQLPAVIAALKAAHPYEEVAYDVVSLDNPHNGVGSGIIGYLPEPQPLHTVLQLIKTVFRVPMLKHTPHLGKPIQSIALCGGAGSFLTPTAIREGADLFLTADLKYHEFFEANNQLVIVDIGHFESEQFTIPLLAEFITAVKMEKNANFAVLEAGTITNPVTYF